MLKYLTEKELKDELKKITIISDTREQVQGHILDYLDKKKIPYISRKLDIGDYSFQMGEYTFEKSIAIERKHNLDELCGNLTADRDRFEREFLRAKANNTKVYLVIENASWNDVYLHNYASKLNNNSLLASLLSWQVRYNITIIFCKKENTPKLIYGIFYYAAREILTRGEL